MKSWSVPYCEQIINDFLNDNQLNNFEHFNRKYKRHIITDKTLSIWESIDDLIKSNLGIEYYLSHWIIGLKYDKGDYFAKHSDGQGNDKEGYGLRIYSGGIELSNKNDYDGGNYILNGVDSKSKQGHLFLHKPDEVHEITKVKRGTRYSLHFCISKSSNNLI
jgi:hypothetical protein